MNTQQQTAVQEEISALKQTLNDSIDKWNLLADTYQRDRGLTANRLASTQNRLDITMSRLENTRHKLWRTQIALAAMAVWLTVVFVIGAVAHFI